MALVPAIRWSVYSAMHMIVLVVFVACVQPCVINGGWGRIYNFNFDILRFRVKIKNKKYAKSNASFQFTRRVN